MQFVSTNNFKTKNNSVISEHFAAHLLRSADLKDL